MRELKFRGWDSGKMYGPFEIGSATSERYFDVIEQYTGLKDKNGKEIYEGDILVWSNGYKHIEYYTIVVFSNGSFKCRQKYGGEQRIEVSSSGGCTNNFFIAGNIHENKELLNDTE